MKIDIDENGRRTRNPNDCMCHSEKAYNSLDNDFQSLIHLKCVYLVNIFHMRCGMASL